MPFWVKKGKDYFFEQGDDYWENWFIATTKNNPIIDKWHFVLNKFWSNRKNGDGILETEMFKNIPRPFYMENYLTMHVSFRKIIGDDPLSRKIFLNHTIKNNGELTSFLPH